MPQRSKGARLYPYKRKGRPAMYFIRDGEYFRTTGFTVEQRKEADGELLKYLRKKRPNTNRTDIGEIWVAEVLKLYADDTPEEKPSKALIGYHLKALEPYWVDKRLSDVKGSTCKAYKAFRLKKGVKEATVRRELKTMQAAINHWHKESPLEAVPRVTLPEEGERRERVLEHREAVRMLRACRARKLHYVERFILIGLHTGTRHDAILNLRWKEAPIGGHVDLKRGIIYRKGSAEKETSKRRPPVQIGGKFLRLMREWGENDAKHGHTHVIRYRGKAIKGGFRKAWGTIRIDAGLGPEVTPHVLRHSCVSWNLWAGKTIWEVAGHVGADASTIERVYGHHRIRNEEKKP